jgi:hypothetical protein
MSAVNPFIRLDPGDNVVVARADVPAGTLAPGEGVTTLEVARKRQSPGCTRTSGGVGARPERRPTRAPSLFTAR